MRLTNIQLKKLVRDELKLQYGFAPKLNEIVLLEAVRDGSYVLFRVDVHTYRYNNGYTIEKIVD